jgi:hypothetical protein
MDSFSVDNIAATAEVLYIVWILIAGLFYLFFTIFFYLSLWKIFVKAGETGWYAIVPFFNFYILYRICFEKPLPWFLITYIPVVNMVVIILSLVGLSRVFEKSVVFMVISILLCGLTIPILAFDKSEYCPENRLDLIFGGNDD